MTARERDKFILKEFLRHVPILWRRFPGRKAVKYVHKSKFVCELCGFSRKRPKHPYSRDGKAADRKVAAQFEVDHITPVGKKPTRLEGLIAYARRKLCLPSNLRVLCKDCHKGKTGKDRKRGWK